MKLTKKLMAMALALILVRQFRRQHHRRRGFRFLLYLWRRLYFQCAFSDG